MVTVVPAPFGRLPGCQQKKGSSVSASHANRLQLSPLLTPNQPTTPHKQLTRKREGEAHERRLARCVSPIVTAQCCVPRLQLSPKLALTQSSLKPDIKPGLERHLAGARARSAMAT
jgi:hypothetical protein